MITLRPSKVTTVLRDDELSCDITRRHALRIAIRGVVVLVGVLLLGKETDGAVRWQRAGTTGQFKVGVPTRVTLPSGTSVYILRQDRGQWLAISPKCSHAGAEVRWNPAQKRFVCLLHGASFTADGQGPTGPARGPLARYHTQIKGKDLQVDVTRSPYSGGRNGGGKRDGRGKERDHEDDEHEGRDRGSDE